MKRIVAVFLLICMLLSLGSCASDKNNSNNDVGNEVNSGTKDTVSISFSSDRGTLDPLYFSGFDIQNCMCLVYEPLWAWDNEGNQIFKLATACEYVSPTVWRISLREGVKFTNGNEFNADDVLFTLYMANNRNGEAAYLPELDLENTKAIDEHTVELVFHNYDMTYTSTMGMLLMYDKESYNEETISSEAIGTGPYKVDDYVVNSHLNLSVNEGYWGEIPEIGHIEFKLISEDSQKTNELAAGTIDMSTVPFQDIEYVQGLGDYNVVLDDIAETSALYFNTSSKSIFHDNVEARQAVCLAIDREAIADIAYSGYATVSEMPCAASNIDVTEEMKYLGVYGEGYNPEKAAELAESSGLAGQTITICTDGASDSVVVAECIQSDLGAIGVNVEIKNYDAGTWMTVLFDANEAGDMMLYMVAMPSHTVAACMSSWYLYGIGGALATNDFPEKETMDELVNGILSISDEEELLRRNIEICRIHSEAALWFGLVDKQKATAYKIGLEGYKVMRMLNVDYANLYWSE